MSNKYEMTLVFKPTLDEEGIKSEYDQIVEILNRFEATVEKIDDWGKRRLAYEIEKTHEGFYRFVTFNAPAPAIAEIESRMRIRENILRYLIIKHEEPSVKIEKTRARQTSREEHQEESSETIDAE